MRGAATPSARAEALVRAYVEPHIRLCNNPDALHYVQLLEPLRSKYLKAIGATVPPIPAAALSRLFSFMVSLMVTAPADSAYGSLTGRSPWPKDPQRLVEQIVAFVTAGLLDAERRATDRHTIGSRRSGNNLRGPLQSSPANRRPRFARGASRSYSRSAALIVSAGALRGRRGVARH
jgi:hypothetical protein